MPKCYCTRLCSAKLDRLAANCASNELHADECGVCLKCARALGQSCGGFRNAAGVCAGGLVCKIRLPPTSIDRKKDEQQATGTCVREEDRECFRFNIMM